MTSKFSLLRYLTAALLLPMLLIQGCTSKATILSLTQTLGTAAANIATLEGNPTLATKLNTDTAAAIAAINSWKSGTPAQDVIEALNIVEDDLNLIPAASQYAALIDIAIGAVDGILALLPAPAPTAAIATHAARRHVILTQPTPKTAAQFKVEWNSAATTRGLNAAVIK